MKVVRLSQYIENLCGRTHMKKIAALSGLVVALAGVAAHADEARWPKWYLGLHGSVPFVAEKKIETGGVNRGTLAFDSGWGAGASLGYMPTGGSATGFGSIFDALRLEFEYDHKESNVDSLSTVPGLATGDVKVNAYMGNVFYDFSSDTGFKPYVGLGAGYANLDMNSTSLGISGDDSVFAYQALAGVYYEPDLLPYTQWGLGYRFFDTINPEIGAGATATKFNYQAHSVEAGARFRF
jgi:opacity protein-like surface antigen